LAIAVVQVATSLLAGTSIARVGADIKTASRAVQTSFDTPVQAGLQFLKYMFRLLVWIPVAADLTALVGYVISWAKY